MTMLSAIARRTSSRWLGRNHRSAAKREYGSTIMYPILTGNMIDALLQLK